MIKIWRLWKRVIGGLTEGYSPEERECLTALPACIEEELTHNRYLGFHALWIHAQINELVQTKVFPALGQHASGLQNCVQQFIVRAGKHLIQIYLYMQLPGALPEGHPDMAMNSKRENRIVLPFCPSILKVREYHQVDAHPFFSAWEISDSFEKFVDNWQQGMQLFLDTLLNRKTISLPVMIITKKTKV